MQSWWLMRLKNQYCFASLFITCLIGQTGCLILYRASSSLFCTILLELSSMCLCKISFLSSSNPRLPFSVLKENKTLCLESANGRCSVKKMFFFVTSPWCGHCLTYFAREDLSHKRLLFPQIILPEMRAEGIRSLRNSAVLVQ